MIEIGYFDASTIASIVSFLLFTAKLETTNRSFRENKRQKLKKTKTKQNKKQNQQNPKNLQLALAISDDEEDVVGLGGLHDLDRLPDERREVCRA
jgi:hypothetical protein